MIEILREVLMVAFLLSGSFIMLAILVAGIIMMYQSLKDKQ